MGNKSQHRAYAESLRKRIIESLRDQGFGLTEKGIELPGGTDKSVIRELHSVAVEHKVERGSRLRSKESSLVNRIASGKQVYPDRISPRLVEVMPRSEEELLFRYASLHWSIPVSSGYGRRIRFLVIDGQNEKLIGIIGLGDPVFSLRNRDQWVGWEMEQRRNRLRHVVDAYVLGAVPPYSALLGGKLVAMLAASEEVRTAFECKYKSKTTIISGEAAGSSIAMITTTSALGSSSMYNRIRFNDRLLYKPVGYTVGFGEFHFANGLYGELQAFAAANCKPTAKHNRWGSGFRSRREVIGKALAALGLPQALGYHGVERQIYVVPLASNTQAFLRGEEDHLDHYSQSTGTLFEYFKHRWLLPRARRVQSYRDFEPESFLLWQEPKQAHMALETS